MSYDQEYRQRSWMFRPFKYVVILGLLAIAVMAAYHYFIARPMSSPFERLASALGEVTQRKVKMDGHTLILESTETRELVVIKRKTQAILKYETRWLGSDKVVIVQGTFLVKAGFDLSEFEGFEVQGNEVVGEWPEPRILSVEQQDYQIFFSESGIVNKIQESDYQRVSTLLNQQARRDAILKSDILEEADRIIATRLQDLTGGEFEFSRKEKLP
ncbi:DUF4230 domain-containing protein [Verrucomicrobiaceae bacterium 227]